MIRCTVGVFAHNEAHNVRLALNAIIAQELRSVSIAEIIVVASGCTDQTVEFAEEIARANPLVRVDVETHRSGKASAIRRLMAMATSDVIVMVGADTLPSPTALEALVSPFADPAVGMTGARVVPLNPATDFMGFAVQTLWNVHHHLALRKPKLGELVACRNVVADFPADTSTDELALEAIITRLGYSLRYAPDAVVYNKGPETLRDFFVQRRRIFAGELRIALRYRYLAASLNARHVVPLAIEALFAHPREAAWTLAVMALELWARLLGTFDTLRGREATIWRHAVSTKKVVATDAEPVTLISVQWPTDTVDGRALVKELKSLPQNLGSVCWSDSLRGELLVRLHVAESPEEWLRRRLAAASVGHADTTRGASIANTISCRVVRFAPAAAPSIN